MRALTLIRLLAPLLVLAVAATTLGAESPLTPEALRGLLARFPAADTNGDGVLTLAEAEAYAQARGVSLAAVGRSSNRTVAASVPAPTRTDVPYGPHPRNVLDVWLPQTSSPAAVVVYFHGGGFNSGDKSRVRGDRSIPQLLQSGVAFVAVNYRFLAPDTPLPQILRDCARAVQFVRSQAASWNLDPHRMGAYGSSAGAGAALWLAFHDELADPNHPDPVLRESTRLACVAATQPQFSYDFMRWSELFDADILSRLARQYLAPQMLGFNTMAELESAEGRRVRADCDLQALISRDDPPVFLSASQPDLALENTSQLLHHPSHAGKLYERCRESGVPVVAQIPALAIKPPAGAPGTWREFMLQHLQ